MHMGIAMGMYTIHALIIVVFISAIWAADELVPGCTDVVPLINRCWFAPYETRLQRRWWVVPECVPSNTCKKWVCAQRIH
jgi:hypothetical protein